MLSLPNPLHPAWAAGLLVVSALAGCTSTPATTGMGASRAPHAVIIGPPLTAAERDFATKAAAKGMYEVEVSRLAMERATSPSVRSYAQTMVQQHTQANNELVALMSARGVTPPQGLPADRANKLHRLAALPPSDAFDNGYMRVVGIEDHQSSISQFEKARRDVKDRELRLWIERSLSMMRAHLKSAQGIAASLAG